MDAATLSGLFTSTTTTSSTTTTTSSSSSTTTDAADDDVTPRWNDGSVFKRVHAIQQLWSKRRSSGSSQPPRPKQRPRGKSDSRFLQMQQNPTAFPTRYLINAQNGPFPFPWPPVGMPPFPTFPAAAGMSGARHQIDNASLLLLLRRLFW